MINRICIVAAAVLLIVWQGGCMYWFDGTLINRCGLWQWWTGHAIYLSLNDILPSPELPVPLREDYTPPSVIIPPEPPARFRHRDNAPSVMSSVTMTMGEPEYTPHQLPQMSMQMISGTMAAVTATLGVTYGSTYIVSPPPMPQNICTTTTSGTALILPPGTSTTTGAQYFIQNNGSGQVCIITNGAGK